MKFFERDGKYNWIDEDNVFVGYSNDQNGCENADYFYSLEQPTGGTEGLKEAPDLEPYHFETGYRQDLTGPDYEDGGAVTFRMLANGKPDIYLTLFNVHNGYYSHGFEMCHGSVTVYDGAL